MPQPIRIPDVAGKVAPAGPRPDGQRDRGALEASGATVWAWDDSEPARSAMPAGMIVELARPLGTAGMLVMSPASAHFPAPHPVAALRKPQASRFLVTSSCCIARCRGSGVGITGTNGKSTTTTLIAHILRQGASRYRSVATSVPQLCHWNRCRATAFMCSNWAPTSWNSRRARSATS